MYDYIHSQHIVLPYYFYWAAANKLLTGKENTEFLSFLFQLNSRQLLIHFASLGFYVLVAAYIH